MQELSIISALITIFDKVGGWPLATIGFFIFMVPPLLLVFVLKNLVIALVSLRDEVREGIRIQQGHYNDNVKLVEQYEYLAGELTTIIRVNTEKTAQLAELIRDFLRRDK